MKNQVVRGIAELAAWALGMAGVVLMLDAGRRDDWLFLLVLVGGVGLMVRIVVWTVRLDRADNRFTRFCGRHEKAVFWVIAPVVMVLMWTTTTVNWWTVVLTVGIGIGAVGHLGPRESSNGRDAD